MAINIYKPGQGYWTRTMSALGGGVLLVGGVFWVWNELSRFQADYIVYVQGASAVAMVAVFGTLLYRFLGTKPRTCDFLVATEGEMKKVNWPSRKGVTGATWVVICCVVLLALLLFISDFVFAWFFQQIDVIRT